MATQALAFGIIKIEDSPSPEPLVVALEPVPVYNPIDPRDPEGFLRRCAGFNKKTKLRCNSVIGQKSQQNCHPTFLPTCRAHRDQQSFAGWCQYQHPTGERCSRLFRWRPPHFELCTEHEGHPDTPCYFFKLPLELRQDIFRYLLPSGPIGSSTSTLHDDNRNASTAAYSPHYCTMNVPLPRHVHHIGTTMPRPPPPPFRPGAMPAPRNSFLAGKQALTGHQSIFPVPLLDLFLVNRQFYQEARDVLFSNAAFTIDVRKDGTFMCGRRLLEPRRADGSSHYVHDETDETKQRFLRHFDWAAVKQYRVDILVENWADQANAVYPSHSSWDEEVEIYDIRDYISVVVSGILAKSKNLCKLQVRLCLADFDWPHEQTLANTKIILGPFERLRNVRQPQVLGVYQGRPFHNMMITVQRPPSITPGSMAPICSVPELPTHSPLMAPGIPEFDGYCADFARWVSSNSTSSVTSKPPIRAMFTEFKDFYSKLSCVVGAITRLGGRQAFLHRARVAREQEDVESFRAIRNELIGYWYSYLEEEEMKKKDINARMSKMLDTDIYPSHEWETSTKTPPRQASPIVESPVLLSATTMAKEGIPLSGNDHHVHNNLMHNMMRPAGSMQHISHQTLHHIPQITRQKQMMAILAQQRAQQLAMQQRTRQMQMAQQCQAGQTYPHVVAMMDLQGGVKAYQHLPVQTVKQEDAQDVDVEMDIEQPESNLTDCGPRIDPQQCYNESPSPEEHGFRSVNSPQVNEVEVGCFAQADLSSDWYTVDDGQPGPSSKRRRTDSGYSDSAMTKTPSQMVMEESVEVVYQGKGKGKAGVQEVICLG